MGEVKVGVIVMEQNKMILRTREWLTVQINKTCPQTYFLYIDVTRRLPTLMVKIQVQTKEIMENSSNKSCFFEIIGNFLARKHKHDWQA